VETLTKKRANNLRMLLLVQLGCYCIYWGVVEYGSLLYLYMLKVSVLTFSIGFYYNVFSLKVCNEVEAVVKEWLG
jgi:membrane-associated protease RseP (regulator of RpoE activity)